MPIRVPPTPAWTVIGGLLPSFFFSNINPFPDALPGVIIGFIVLEATNVIALYFFPGSKYANSVGVFKAWEKSKQDPEIPVQQQPNWHSIPSNQISIKPRLLLLFCHKPW